MLVARNPPMAGLRVRHFLKFNRAEINEIATLSSVARNDQKEKGDKGCFSLPNPVRYVI
jgi:hypothetical protein